MFTQVVMQNEIIKQQINTDIMMFAQAPQLISNRMKLKHISLST